MSLPILIVYSDPVCSSSNKNKYILISERLIVNKLHLSSFLLNAATMPWTNAQTTAFFQANNQMGIPAETRERIKDEGIENVGDLIDFDKEAIKLIAESLQRPAGRILDPNDPDATIPTPPFVFGAKSQKRLVEASAMVRFYDTISRELTPANMRYEPIIRNFGQQWKSLQDRKDGEKPKVPELTRELGVLRWSEAFSDYLDRAIGVRCAPLSYVTRTDAVPVGDIPPLADRVPHSEKFGSIAMDLKFLASHEHPLFMDDSELVYFALETALRGTQYAASLKPYQKKKDGRGAYRAVMMQYCGEDKWDEELKRSETLLHTRVWKGNSNFNLEKFVSQHRNAYISMQQCAEHIPYQLPNDRTRVGYLIDAIQCSDPELQAAIAMVRQDNGENGKMNSFESCASYLIPRDPVNKKRSAARMSTANVAGVETPAPKRQKKSGVGVTGVELRYHQKPEYAKLNKAQKAELYQWRMKKDKSKSISSSDSKIATAVTKQLKKLAINKSADAAAEKQLKDYILSVVNGDAPIPHKDASIKAAVGTTDKQPVDASAIMPILKNKIKKVKISAVTTCAPEKFSEVVTPATAETTETRASSQNVLVSGGTNTFFPVTGETISVTGETTSVTGETNPVKCGDFNTDLLKFNTLNAHAHKIDKEEAEKLTKTLIFGKPKPVTVTPKEASKIGAANTTLLDTLPPDAPDEDDNLDSFCVDLMNIESDEDIDTLTPKKKGTTKKKSKKKSKVKFID